MSVIKNALISAPYAAWPNHGSVALTREILYWLELHGRREINGLHAFEFEMSKLRQDLVLLRYGIQTP